jgi:hypothetical protein
MWLCIIFGKLKLNSTVCSFDKRIDLTGGLMT